MTRPSWDQYFMDLCDLVATRGTCDRKQVGSVLTRDNRILATGYNGSLPGLDHCDKVGHDIVDNHCIRTIHSEANVITECARQGISTRDTVLYCNTRPCFNCMKLLIASGIKEIVYRDEYMSEPKDKVLDMAEKTYWHTYNFALRRI